MEFQRFRARLALIGTMLDQMDSNADHVRHLRRTVYVLRHLIRDESDIPCPYGPTLPIGRFSLQ